MSPKPLKPEVFQILLRLLEGPSHGYEIMHDVRTATDGAMRVLPGALYRHLARMLEEGTIAELDRRAVSAEGDERRRYYEITPRGRDVAAAEAERLARLVKVARAHSLLDRLQ